MIFDHSHDDDFDYFDSTTEFGRKLEKGDANWCLAFGTVLIIGGMQGLRVRVRNQTL